MASMPKISASKSVKGRNIRRLRNMIGKMPRSASSERPRRHGKRVGRIEATLRNIAPERLCPDNANHRADEQDYEAQPCQLAPRRQLGEPFMDRLQLAFDDREVGARLIGLAQREGIVWHALGMPEDG